MLSKQENPCNEKEFKNELSDPLLAIIFDYCEQKELHLLRVIFGTEQFNDLFANYMPTLIIARHTKSLMQQHANTEKRLKKIRRQNKNTLAILQAEMELAEENEIKEKTANHTMQIDKLTNEKNVIVSSIRKKYEKLKIAEPEIHPSEYKLELTEVKQPSNFVEQIDKTIQLLNQLIVNIDNEILQKKIWNNRFRRMRCFDFDDLEYLNNICWFTITQDDNPTRVKNIISLFTKSIILLNVALIVGLILGSIIAAAINDMLGVLYITISFASIAILSFPFNLLIHRDLSRANTRFEEHRLSLSFSSSLNKEFAFLTEKIAPFQDNQEENQHELLKINPKSAKIKDIRRAIQSELTFFSKIKTACEPQSNELLQSQIPINN